MSDIPSVKVYENITPANSGTGEGVLEYDILADAVKSYEPSHAVRSAEAWSSPVDTLDEERTAKQLAMEYLLRTALKGVESASIQSQYLWAERFTQASIELLGEPDRNEVTGLIFQELEQLNALRSNQDVDQTMLNFLLDTYQNILGPDTSYERREDDSEDRELEKAAIAEYGENLRDRYQPIFDLVDDAEIEEFDPESLQNLFTRAIQWMAENHDPDWALWEVVYRNATSLDVVASKRQIRIGSRREPASPVMAKKLLAHELLVHALRGQNAYASGDQMLLKGYPGFVDTDEGLGKISEESIGGISDIPGRDRYVDIALALGTVNGIQKTRQELFQIHLSRSIINAQASSSYDETMMPILVKRAWSSVDRIYRGGKGDSSGTIQAVYTKDIVYYTGYKKMAAYLSQQRAIGKTMPEIFDFLLQGRFDPTNPKHIEQLAKAQV
ncbi:MAG: flavohemoglobin expression-modulating QEGLA motif protein [bacterium]|nr:flavohemoglobin expression-modulating QEGLA motif protein [bacterium]